MKPAKAKIVTVTVDEEGNASCRPHTLTVKQANVLVSFQLDTPGYAFADNEAITVDSPGTQFPYASWTPLSSQAALLDLGTENGDFTYHVNVIEIASGKVLRIDPTIENRVR